MKILVTGAGGQLGRCIEQASHKYPGLHFTFTTSDELDLTQFAVVGAFMRREKFDLCINCAAYTNVEQAEKQQEMAYLINAESVNNLARDCDETGCTLIHISTDYVFNGRKNSPYTEEDSTDPLNVYGASKLLGEQYIQEATDKYVILRTSWLYSEVGKNFFNSICSKAGAGETLNITSSQKGTPTNAHDLARFILNIIAEEKLKFGLYHYSNLGEATWLDFAREIVSLTKPDAVVVENNDFKTLALRPSYSVLSKQKVQEVFGLPVPHWKESLKQLIYRL
ncbi:dTDP-4-dehydrorhamnose reductase [Salinimicrobium tongyeongense]|jgi:dTDP-4-dehydrorhamnose reductase|uniref:dTDP-4-dehydrorhamnose reductase n=1 Tax=Salinimicrobium tongyeongense TaxID=2809707 RepID=A0ABY6NUN4_9FLAO|nr:dTDP-4-dehydrorhamnose reductase [Salinimicrobium tongyeongense]UZH56625.1 dTDP-4-dehydrorhamnose reductase [Salinimicrobium tongyeongense]